jgi:DMSO/TMAO reductase YedYZ molybdopterin-dependent catalytic subunit
VSEFKIMVKRPQTAVTRRKFLRSSAISGGLLLAGLDKFTWPGPQKGQRDPFAAGKQIGVVEFIHEGPAPLETSLGAELDGRLYTDLSQLSARSLITPTEKFYLRTRASQLLPDTKGWEVRVDGLAAKPFALAPADLVKAAQPMGAHLMECAGNGSFAGFGMLSVAEWSGVPVTEILAEAKEKPSATRVLVSGFDRYATPSVSSTPGASWVFTLDDLKSARAFLATQMNGESLTRDHGAPVRLVVPGWYGCTCIKWVESITLVDDSAEATSQMQEYASRTAQKGTPRLAREYQPARIEQAAMPVRVEKWQVSDKILYRVVGVAWGGSRPAAGMQIRFNPEEDYVAVDNFSAARNDPWTIWTHAWSPKTPGTYSIRLALKDASIPARRLDSGYYVRTVEITEV